TRHPGGRRLVAAPREGPPVHDRAPRRLPVPPAPGRPAPHRRGQPGRGQPPVPRAGGRLLPAPSARRRSALEAGGPAGGGGGRPASGEARLRALPPPPARARDREAPPPRAATAPPAHVRGRGEVRSVPSVPSEWAAGRSRGRRPT